MPASAATKRWLTAPIASAATAVRSAGPTAAGRGRPPAARGCRRRCVAHRRRAAGPGRRRRRRGAAVQDVEGREPHGIRGTHSTPVAAEGAARADRQDRLRDALKRAAVGAEAGRAAVRPGRQLRAVGARRARTGARRRPRGGRDRTPTRPRRRCRGRFRDRADRRRTGCSRRTATAAWSTSCTGSTATRSTPDLLAAADGVRGARRSACPVLRADGRGHASSCGRCHEHYCDFAALLPRRPRGARAARLGAASGATPPTTTSPPPSCSSPTGWGSAARAAR